MISLQLKEVEKFVGEAKDRVGHISSIAEDMKDVWAKNYAVAEKKGDSAIAEVDRKVAEAEKRALSIMKDVHDQLATIAEVKNAHVKALLKLISALK